MQTETLIQLLVDDLSPVRTLASPWRRSVAWTAVSLMSVIVLIVFLSPDPARIANIHAVRFWLEQVAAIATAFAAAAAAMTAIVPGRSRRADWLTALPLVAWISVLLWGCAQDWARRGVAGLVIYPDWPCVVAMMVASALPATLIAGMLRRGAPIAPRGAAAFAGLAVAALSSATACLSRPSPHGTTATVLVWHFGMVLVLVTGAAMAGPHVRDWRVTSAVARRLR